MQGPGTRPVSEEPGLILHSDRGSGEFQQAPTGYGMCSSMSRKGDCWDSAVTESLWGSLKVARLHGRRFESSMNGLGSLPSKREPHNALGYGMRKSRARSRARLTRIEAGNLGDCNPLREGVQELRIDHGPCYRVYLSRQGAVLVLLLCGRDKSHQQREIARAIEYLEDWKQRGKP